MTSSPQPFSGAFSGKKIFLTGHTGFKGAWLCQWLEDLGADVTGFSLPDLPTSPSLYQQLDLRVKDLRGDIRDAGAVRKAILEAQPDFVFHLAAQPLVRLSYEQPSETYQTNVMGTINVLEALRTLQEELSGSHPHQSPRQCVAVMITTDKCYENREWLHGYREEDPLGGHDPYSSSKAACEIAISSWRRSFFSPQSINSSSSRPSVLIASARAGNVIGGGDWARARIVPDLARGIDTEQTAAIRNPSATRPWQHVLEPLGGYLLLAATLATGLKRGEEEKLNKESAAPLLNPSTPQPLNLTTPQLADLCSAFNFGPNLDSNCTVLEVVQEMGRHADFRYEVRENPKDYHEAGQLHLAIDKAFHLLGWRPRWNFKTTIEKTATWYREARSCRTPEAFRSLTRRQIQEYEQSSW